MKGQGAALAFVLVFCVAQAALAVLFALAVREIINAATAENAAYAHIVRCSVLLAATVCLQCALKLTLGFMRENMRTRTEISLRKRAFRAVLGGRYGEIAKYHSGDILNRVFTDASIVADGASAILPSLASAASRLIFTAAALFVLSPIFTAILLAACVVAFFVAMAFRKKLKGLHTEMREADGRSREFTQESVENLLAVKVFEAEDKFAAKGEKLLGDYRDKYLRRNRVSVLGTECFDIAFRVFYVAAMILGVFAIFRGETDYGTLAAMLQLIGQIQMPVIALSGRGPALFYHAGLRRTADGTGKISRRKEEKGRNVRVLRRLKSHRVRRRVLFLRAGTRAGKRKFEDKEGAVRRDQGRVGHRQEHAFETCARRVSARKGRSVFRNGGGTAGFGLLRAVWPTCRRETCFFRARCAKTCSF